MPIGHSGATLAFIGEMWGKGSHQVDSLPHRASSGTIKGIEGPGWGVWAHKGSHMNIDHLRELLAIERYGSLAAASRIIFVSQPNLSHHIASLERELGFDLIVRDGGKTVSFTYEGRAMLDMAKSIVAQYDYTIKKCRHTATLPANTVTVGLPLYFESFPDAHRAFHETLLNHVQARFDKLTINLRYMSVGDSMKVLLGDGTLDWGYGPSALKGQASGPWEQADGFTFIPLVEDELVIKCSADHPLGSRREVTFHDIEPYPITVTNNPSTELACQTFQDLIDIEGAILNLQPGRRHEAFGEWIEPGSRKLVLAPVLFAGQYDRVSEQRSNVVPIRLETARFYSGVLLRDDNPNPVVREVARFAADFYRQQCLEGEGMGE